jgi:hypothetical protein
MTPCLRLPCVHTRPLRAQMFMAMGAMPQLAITMTTKP